MNAVRMTLRRRGGPGGCEVQHVPSARGFILRRVPGRVGAVDAAQALKDLTEISSQIEAAVLVGADGSLLASTLADDTAGMRLADAARALVDAAEAVPRESGEGPLVQLEATTLVGSFFVVRDEVRVVAAVTTPEPTAGLVFFDLKSCLRAAAAEEGDGKPRPRPRRARTRPEEEVSGEANS